MPNPAYNATDYRQRRAAAIAAEPWCHHDFCQHDDVGTPTNPLTGHHTPPLARLRPGQPYTLTVLCKRCNASLGDC